MNSGALLIKTICFGLNEGEAEEIPRKEIEKSFDYEEDIEDLGRKLDKNNRTNYTEEELDSIFVTSDANVLKNINSLRSEENEEFKESIDALKKEALSTEILFSSEEFDIFGSMSEDQTKINVLGNIKHREIKKNKFRILNITKNTKNTQYVEKIKEIMSDIDKTLDKAKFGVKLKAFYASTENLNTRDYNILHINPKNALEEVKGCNKINLYNIKLNEKTNGIALTNIAYYKNNNKTLPLGMNISDKILVDMSKLNLELKKQKLFRINQEVDELRVETKIICVYEYEVINTEE